jgi:hypothetical protein
MTEKVNKATADEAMQKQLGTTAGEWRQANACEQCARSLSRDAQRRARVHNEAAADARSALGPAPNATPDVAHHLVFLDHHQIVERSLAIAGAHKVVADRARREAIRCAVELVYKLTPELVRQRLSSLDPAMAATITRLYGHNLADTATRARVFEACDFVQWEGAKESDLNERKSILLPSNYSDRRPQE